ncbi:hypothetical protein SDRG_14934 [Saprolegnia diclina VS20]|uniref:Uncharacterized protein n=1 Tax=Saprolegnia diclina (strain VS20) TaxID=1156394 RepID=T0R5H5_SAPDV|nr:hypothetical protein SDRG_14934 [Saprolegnia diclina VS20]EQC27313.1 hypothetical protein SDRG_14934 [Saprolegnia diclina VS20]|eukprot:XP_008619316.1 hypothetical protein SDRG_14934 [Saprolegnia diclina VS20]
MASEATPLLAKAPAPVRASCTSALFFTWLSPLLALGATKTLDVDDLYPIEAGHDATTVVERFLAAWAAQCACTSKPSLLRALFRAFGWRFFLAGLLRGIRATLLFTAPLVLKAMIAFLSDPSAPSSHGYVLVSIIFVSGVLQSLCIRQYTYLASEVGMCFRSALQAALYRKTLRIAPSADRSSGQVTNLMSIDATRVQKLTVDLHSIWVVPYLILLSSGLLWREIGVSFLAGVGVILLFVPLTLRLATYMKSIQKRVMQFKDDRTKLCNEVFAGVKVIKCQAWEESFVSRIQTKRTSELAQLRTSELAQLRTYLVTRAVSNAMSNGLPAFTAVASFGLYVLLGHSLDVSTALTSLALFNILRLPLLKLPDMVNAILEAQISLDRLRDYLLSPDRVLVTSGSLLAPGVEWANATLEVPGAQTSVLRNVSLAVGTSTLVAIVGPTGSGKTSLLRSVLGEVAYASGSVAQRGAMAYVAQQPFILNATVRDNICFGLPYDRSRYDQAIDVACLTPDLALLPAGDRTEIGEKGINLSGGQKTRVALARAVYQDADVYLLDDVLAAVDAHVGARIVCECFQRVLKPKLILLATNASSALAVADAVVVLADGMVQASGTLTDVAIHPYVAKMLADAVPPPTTAPIGVEAAPTDAPLPASTCDTALMVAEDRTRGSVTASVYSVWLHACGGWATLLLVGIVYVAAEATSVAGTVWLSYWSEHVSGSTVRLYLCIFVSLQMAYVVGIFSRAAVLYIASLRGSQELFRSMLLRVVRAPMLFFETTPLGQLANRFTSDVYTADESLPATWSALLVTATTVVFTVGTIVAVTPLFAVILLPTGWAYWQSQRYYLHTARELQRLESISKSPVLSLFGETLEGLSTIRAAAAESAFAATFDARVNRNVQALWLNFSVNCWLSLRLEVAGTVVASFAGLCAVWVHAQGSSALFAGLAGVSLSYAFTMTKYMTQSVTNYSSLQTQMIAVERMDAYTRVRTEAVGGSSVPPAWPTTGAVAFHNVGLRYQPKRPLVLQNVTFAVPGGAKVGVVGRTGAGKSSLVVALMRLVEVDAGRITIDGVDVATVPLHRLRDAVSIVPQDPVLFSGSLRYNLDPLQLYSDDRLWAALKAVHLTGVGSLDDVVAERGGNYSVGERQLLCMARALLKQSKVIVMDEATASVDPATDRRLQATIRDVFADCTCLTIAHRLNTVLDADVMLVLDAGAVAEFGPPSTLLANPDGLLSHLVGGHAAE